MSQLADPFNVNYLAPGVKSNNIWTKAKTVDSTLNSYPLKQNWSSVATSSDGKFVLACVYGGKVYSSSNYGYDLLPDNSLPDSTNWRSVSISPDGTKAAACAESEPYGHVYIASLSGTSWVWKQYGLVTSWWSVTFSGDSLSIAACVNSTTASSTKCGIFTGTYDSNTSLWSFSQSNTDAKNWVSITYINNTKNFTACIDDNNNNYNIFEGIYSSPTWSWTQVFCPKPIRWSSITSNSDGSKVFACAESSGHIYVGTSNLTTWTQTSAPAKNWSSISTNSSGQYIIACVNGGGLYCSIDSGASWQEQTNGLTNPLSWTSVHVASNTSGSFLVGCVQNEYIYISPYFQGYQWNNSSVAFNNTWNSVASDNTGQNLIVSAFGGQDGYIYTSNNYGINYTKNDITGTFQNWNYVASNGNGTILGAVIASGDAYIINYNDSTPAWTKQNLEPTDTPNCNQISFNSSGTHAVVCSYYTNGYPNGNGKIYVTTNTSLNVWTPINPNPNSYLTSWIAIKFSSDNQQIYACFWSVDLNDSNYPKESGIYNGSLTNGNWTWTKIKSNTDPGSIYYYNTITFSNDYSVIATTNLNEFNNPTYPNTGSFISVSSNSGSTFNSTNLGQNVTVEGYGFQCVTMDTTGKKIAAVFYDSPAYTGSIFISLDSGLTWITQIQGLPTTQNAWKSIASNENMTKLITCAFSGASNYGGSSGIFTAFLSETYWTQQLNAVPTRNCFTKLTSSNNGQYLAVVAENQSNNNDYGGIWISLDNGSTWIKSDAGNLCWNAISSDNTGQYLVAGVFGGQIYTSSNYGLNWTIQSSTSGLPTSGSWTSISFSNNSDSLSQSQYVYAQVSQTSNSYIYYSTNKGITWIQTLGAALWNNGMASSSNGYYAYYGVNNPSTTGPGGYGIYKTTSDDINLFISISISPEYWNYIACDSTGKYVAAVNTNVNQDYSNLSYGIDLNTNYGDPTSWTQITSKALYWTSISLINMGNYLLINAICTNGLVYTCNYSITDPPADPLYTWTLQGGLPASQWNDIKSSLLPSGDVQLVICSTNGGIWKSSDSGETWSQSVLAYTSTYNPPNSSSYIPNITSSSTGQNLVAIVNSGYLYNSTDFGSNWNPLPNSLPYYTYMLWYSIASSITGQYIVVSTIVGDIFKSDNYGKSWIKSVTTYAYPILSMSSSGQYIIAASNGGSIYLSSDYGSIWIQLTTINGLPSIPEAWSAISISESGQYIAASILGGGIYVSSNFGSTWFSINLNKNWSSIAISNSGQNMVATISAGSIYGSSNFGITWADLFSPTIVENWSSISISGTGQYISASINDGSIYGSSNFGSTWSQINITTTTEFNSITSSNSGQYLAAIGINSTTPTNTDIYIYSNFMDIGNIYGSLINQLQIQMQYQNPTPTGSINAFLGTSDPYGWVIMDGQSRTNNGQYNNLLAMGIGTGTNNNSIYTPPNYQGAFLRGTGNGGSYYTGPALNQSQGSQAALYEHSHTISLNYSDPGHAHNISTKNGTDDGNFNDANYLCPADNGPAGASSNNACNSALTGITFNPSASNTKLDQDTRPYNFGVNWILKL
jgi:hypothetical protein